MSRLRVSFCLDLLLLLKMEEVRSSETSVDFCRTGWYHIPENYTFVVFVPEIFVSRDPAVFQIARLCAVNHPQKFTGFYREWNMSLRPLSYLPCYAGGGAESDSGITDTVSSHRTNERK